MNENAFTSLEHSTFINAPSEMVYERWNRVDEYPAFMEGVREIRWLGEQQFVLISESNGNIYESVCEVALRIPNTRLAWRTISGPDSSGVVEFQQDGSGTVVTLKMRYDPQSGWENPDQIHQRLVRNLARFKALVENAGA